MSTVANVESGGTVRVDASIEGSLSKRDGYGMTTASTVLRRPGASVRAQQGAGDPYALRVATGGCLELV